MSNKIQTVITNRAEMSAWLEQFITPPPAAIETDRSQNYSGHRANRTVESTRKNGRNYRATCTGTPTVTESTPEKFPAIRFETELNAAPCNPKDRVLDHTVTVSKDGIVTDTYKDADQMLRLAHHDEDADYYDDRVKIAAARAVVHPVKSPTAGAATGGYRGPRKTAKSTTAQDAARAVSILDDIFGLAS